MRGFLNVSSDLCWNTYQGNQLGILFFPLNFPLTCLFLVILTVMVYYRENTEIKINQEKNSIRQSLGKVLLINMELPLSSPHGILYLLFSWDLCATHGILSLGKPTWALLFRVLICLNFLIECIVFWGFFFGHATCSCKILLSRYCLVTNSCPTLLLPHRL